MRTYIVILVLTVGAASGNSASFQNLGFDEAFTNNIVSVAPGGGFAGPANELLPGWRLSSSIREESRLGYNQFTIGLNYATLYDSHFMSFEAPPPVEGKYALGLYPGPADNGAFAAYHLSQSGAVPADAKTIRFTNFGGPFDLRVNGELLPLVYEYPPDYVHDRFVQTLVPVPVVGDISAFAGNAVELDFITLPSASAFDFFLKGIDSVSFSPELIPEPSTSALLVSGALAFLFRRGYRRRNAGP